VIARDGKTVQSFGTMTSPDSTSFVNNIEQLLNSK
jgi:glutathione peroxidase-family protein